MQDSAIMGAMNAAGAFFRSDAERRRYIDRELIRMDWESGMSASREEGRAEEREELVFGALQRHKNIPDVAAYLGLPEAYVRQVAVNHGLSA